MLRIGVDIGGTFTDFAAWRNEHELVYTTKVPSTPPRFAEGFRQGFERVLEFVKPCRDEVMYVVHGTTISTNTVIERSGPSIALFTTKGFRDILELQRLRLKRPLNINEQRTVPLVSRDFVYEIRERVDGSGNVKLALDEDAVRDATRAAVKAGAIGIGVALMHSYRNPMHERRVRELIHEVAPRVDVTLSVDVWPKIGEYERAVISVLNAYVRNKMDAYIGEIEVYLRSRVSSGRLFITKSNGGLMAAEEARRLPVHTLLSGPAAGVAAVQCLGEAVGKANYLAMDMGGTSTDISLIRDGVATVSNSAEVGDFPLIMPVTGIEAIGAGGGSVAWINSGVLKVGPQSSGAMPGPACFMRGGSLPTVTDAYLASGYLNPSNFLGGSMSLDKSASEEAITKVATPLGLSSIAASEAIISVATSNMVAAALPYLAKYGIDPDELTLVVYGGNGAIHGPLLADEIGIPRVLVPPTPSVFCAYGGLVSELAHDVVRTVHGSKITENLLSETLKDLENEARVWLRAQAEENQLIGVKVEAIAAMRYAGQSFEIDVSVPSALAGIAVAESLFHDEHQRLFGYCNRQGPVEFVELRVRIKGALPAPAFANAQPVKGENPVVGHRTLHIGGRVHKDCAIYDRMKLSAGASLEGPAVIEQNDATVLVPDRFAAEVTSLGNILLKRKA